jgi:hypothetical protein
MNNTITSAEMLLVGAPSTVGSVEGTPDTTIAPRKPLRRRTTIDRAMRIRMERAIYSHIRAMRALGRTRIDTREIAKALGLSTVQVVSAIGSLKRKGVRVI